MWFQLDVFPLDTYPRVTIVGRGSRLFRVNCKELVDLGIFIALLALISHGHSLSKPLCAENGERSDLRRRSEHAL
jgi:hypothetical protein